MGGKAVEEPWTQYSLVRCYLDGSDAWRLADGGWRFIWRWDHLHHNGGHESNRSSLPAKRAHFLGALFLGWEHLGSPLLVNKLMILALCEKKLMPPCSVLNVEFLVWAVFVVVDWSVGFPVFFSLFFLQN